MIEDMTIRNLSRATQQSYLYAVSKFSRHFGAPPDRLGIEDVRAYQLHLIGQKRSWSHVNQAACGLRFFYGVARVPGCGCFPAGTLANMSASPRCRTLAGRRDAE
jgi:hypothetical protein